MSELLSAGLHTKFDRLSVLSTRDQADLAQQTAGDFGYRASAASIRHSAYRSETGSLPTGNQIVASMRIMKYHFPLCRGGTLGVARTEPRHAPPPPQVPAM